MANLITKIALGYVSLISGEILADEAKEQVVDFSHGITAGYFFKLGLALLIVLSVFFAFAWLMRRFNQLPAGEAGLHIVGGLNVGSKEKLIVVQIGEEQVLVGITQQNITKLHVLKEALPAAQRGQVRQPLFANVLNSLLTKCTPS